MVVQVLFVLAHPDDEFACSLHIQRANRRAQQVHCAYLTDGSHGSQSVQRRVAESTRALSKLGVDPRNIHFLGVQQSLPDGGLHEHLDTAATLLDAVFEQHGPFATVYIPAWEGGHQDHDASHLVGGVVSRRRGVRDVRQFPLYRATSSPGPFFRVLSPLLVNGPADYHRARLRERFAALQVCVVHRSQWRSWLGLFPFFATKMLTTGRFPTQQVDAARWSCRPHAGALLYERRGALRSSIFAEKADRFLATNSRSAAGDQTW